MDRTAPPMIVIATCLAALAGFVDAIAFTSLGGFFASFMSGNSTRLGVGLGTYGGLGEAAIAAALILCFVAGVIVASVIARARPKDQKSAVMAGVTLLLLTAAVLAAIAPGPIVLLLLAAAMGCENGVFNRDGEVTIGVTYMTGSLVRLGQKAANALMGDKDRWGWVPYLTLWLGFVSGVVLGAASHDRWGWGALWAPPLAAAVLTMALRRADRKA
ncbi:YoaK family protein [Sphingomonas sp.]|jgi:uncharacterized membrane protein YoaK (UPF0700 family)|uniref:YoaK family protein n=1 Tax=Sphingomonas sp. TaxID=28214 RepID=UPI002ED8E89E